MVKANRGRSDDRQGPAPSRIGRVGDLASMILTAAARTDVGRRRSVNEDCFALVADLGLYLVADGMGGHTAGQLASRLATAGTIQALRQISSAEASLTEKLRYCIAGANRQIYDTAVAKPDLAGMGTTLVALLASGGQLALAHVGDSRAYRVRSGAIRQLTDDHSVVGELLRRQEISSLAAKEHPQRHVLTRALGVRRLVEADLIELTPVSGDVVVLCSDGLTGHVSDDEIARCVTAESRPEVACETLVALANERGGEDNITVALIRCDDAEPGAGAA
jgi:protein phosphatase